MRRDRTAPKIKWSIFASFILFTAVILMALWVLQSLLLETFYFLGARNRMREVLLGFENITDAEIFAEHAEDVASEGQIVVLCYVMNERISVYAKADEDNADLATTLDDGTLRGIYERTKQNGGVLQERFDEVLEHSIRRPVRHSDNRMLTATVLEREGEADLLLLLDCAIALPSTTVSTMKQQLVFASLVLLGLAAAVSFFIARHISRPLVRISQKAKRISEGKYNTDFSERSYREIEELSETLNQASVELSKIDRLQKELIANISHDLRTPLTMIIGYAEVMRDIEGENNPENMQVIIDEAKRLSVLVNDLLEISRIQGGISQRHDEAFVMEEMVKETVERYRRLKEGGGFVFLCNAEGETRVIGDKSKILQVLCNLLNNAINYSGEKKQIELSVLHDGDAVRVEVKDYGMGIPEKDLPNVWQRYYKVDKVHRRSSVGSGLGLSIVREILEMHYARYGVTSKVGEGSVFWFSLPVEKETMLGEPLLSLPRSC